MSEQATQQLNLSPVFGAADIPGLRRAAEQAMQRTRSKVQGDDWQVLDRDLAVTRVQASRLMAGDSLRLTPDYTAIAKLWNDAEARWNGYAENGIQATTPPAPLAPPSPSRNVTQLLAALGSRGVTLSIENGVIRAAPSALLNDRDRAVIREHRADLHRLLSNSEVF